MDIRLTTEISQVENRSWLGSRDGTEVTETITLDVTKFVSGTHYVNGYIASGTVLGKVTATGLYGPYDNAVSDGREVAVGFLWNSTAVPTGATKLGAPLQWRGVIKESRLPTNHGLDTAGKADLAAKFRFK